MKLPQFLPRPISFPNFSPTSPLPLTKQNILPSKHHQPPSFALFSITTNLSRDRKCHFTRQFFRSSARRYRCPLSDDRLWVLVNDLGWLQRFPKQHRHSWKMAMVQSYPGLLSQIPTNQAIQHLATSHLTSHTRPPLPLRSPSPTAPQLPSTAPTDPPTAGSPSPHDSPSTPPPPPP